jgi:four helix bundle protein
MASGLLTKNGVAQKLEELHVYQDAMTFWKAIAAILERPGFRRNRKLAEQISRANDSIPANISEGFEQPTDRSFADFLYHSKGSLAEVVARLREAHLKGLVAVAELRRTELDATRLSRSIGAFIRYLDSSDFKDRGRFRSRQRRSAHDAAIDQESTLDPTARDQDVGPETLDQGLDSRPGTADHDLTGDAGPVPGDQ